jgi:tetratricopeptide (TPR) repeat protein
MQKFMAGSMLVLTCLVFLALRPGMHPRGGPGTNGNLDLAARAEYLDRVRNSVRASGVSCIPGNGSAADPEDIRPDENGRFAPVFPGWGHHHYAIATTVDSAQFYFDQGLSLYYSYHLREALASFKEVARRDSNCVMAYWGQALASGPNYNTSYFYKAPAGVPAILETMNRHAGSGDPKEKGLAEVMNKRYDGATGDPHRTQLNRAYSDGMKDLLLKYPGDIDIKALYIDGVMIEHAWNTWEPNGVAKPWTPELVRYCEEILAKDPVNPAALHYHIHLVEASMHPEEALHSADVLQAVMPGVAHMVHMSSHMYQRNGLYAKGVEVNDRANAQVRQYDSLARQLKLGSTILHYHAVEAFCALNAAMYKKGKAEAGRCRQIALTRSGLPEDTDDQYLYMMPAFTLIRMGRWQEILALEVPDKKLLYASVLNEFARGLAFIRLDKKAEAQACLDSLRELMKDKRLLEFELPSNAPICGARISEGILAAEISLAKGDFSAATHWYSKAIEEEDKMVYLEPKDWLLPVRHFAGAGFLKMDKAAEAEKLYREDLIQNPANGWAYLGLYQSLLKQGMKEEAAKYKGKYENAFAHAEEMPPASAY